MRSAKILFKLLTLAWFFTATAQGQSYVVTQESKQPPTSTFKGYLQSLESETYTPTNVSPSIDANKVQDTASFEKQLEGLKDSGSGSGSGGGWNGTGGGGGLACFENFDVQKDVEALNPAGAKGTVATKEGIQFINSFTVMDVADSFIAVSDQGRENFSKVIERNIRRRIGKTLPLMAEYLIHAYQETRKMPLQKVEFISSKADIGGLVAGSLWSMPCLHAQWILRVHANEKGSSSNYRLYVNESLDQHLRQILSPQMYSLQKEILLLHEAIYGVFMRLTQVETSAPTRALIQFIVADELSYAQHLQSRLPEHSNIFWSFFGHRNVILIEKATSLYRDYLKSLNVSPIVLRNFDHYLQFLKAVDTAPMETFSFHFMQQFPGSTIGIPSLADPSQDQYLIFIDFFVADHFYKIESQTLKASDKNFGALSFFLLAHEQHALGKLQSPDIWISDIPERSLRYSKACSTIKDQLIEPVSGKEEVKVIKRYLKRNMKNALTYCGSLKVRY